MPVAQDANVKENRRKLRQTGGFVCGSLSCCFLFVAVCLSLYESVFLLRSVRAEGQVIGYRMSTMQHEESIGKGSSHTVDDGPVYCPQFMYRVQGKSFYGESRACASPPSFAIGQPIGVRYVPSHPENAQIENLGAKWGLSLGFGAGGLLLVLVASVLLFPWWLARLRQRRV